MTTRQIRRLRRVAVGMSRPGIEHLEEKVLGRRLTRFEYATVIRLVMRENKNKRWWQMWDAVAAVSYVRRLTPPQLA